MNIDYYSCYLHEPVYVLTSISFLSETETVNAVCMYSTSHFLNKNWNTFFNVWVCATFEQCQVCHNTRTHMQDAEIINTKNNNNMHENIKTWKYENMEI